MCPKRCIYLYAHACVILWVAMQLQTDIGALTSWEEIHVDSGQQWKFVKYNNQLSNCERLWIQESN